MIRTNLRRPIANRRADTGDSDVLPSEKSLEPRQYGVVVPLQRGHQTHHAHQVANDNAFASDSQLVDTLRCLSTPDGRSLDEINDNRSIEKQKHGLVGCYLAC